MGKARKPKILLGITGGIAAYKACDIINRLKRDNDIKVVMTKNALHFISELTLSSLCGSEVYTDLWDETRGTIAHISEPQNWADLFLVAPATANVIAKFANGIADDYLTTMWIAATCKKLIAPAMNTHMWNAAPMKRNLKTLVDDGVQYIEPASGLLACGTEGIGKLAEVTVICNAAKGVILSNERP